MTTEAVAFQPGIEIGDDARHIFAAAGVIGRLGEIAARPGTAQVEAHHRIAGGQQMRGTDAAVITVFAAGQSMNE